MCKQATRSLRGALAAAERTEKRLLAEHNNAAKNDNTSNLSTGITSNTSAQDNVIELTKANGNRKLSIVEPDETTTNIAPIASAISSRANYTSKQPAWWTISSPNPLNGINQCLVVSQPLQSELADNDISLQLALTDKALYLRTDSAQVSDASQISLRIDTHLPVLFETALSENIAALAANYTAVLNQLLTRSFITVSNVLVADSGVPNSQISEFSLEGFLQAYAQVDTCST